MLAVLQDEDSDSGFQVKALSVASASYIQDIENVVAEIPWSLALIESEFTLPYSRTFGVRQDSQLIGFVVAHFLAPDAHILNLGVLPSKQRKGVGKLLVETVINEAVKAGATRIFLEVRASNASAIRLYERAGFKRQGVRKKYYSNNNEDALVYVAHVQTIPLKSETEI